MEVFINLCYIIAAILFIYGIKMLGSPDTARRGNQVSALGMLLAVTVTLVNQQIFDSWLWIVVGLALGAGIGGTAALRVQMTGMPELVALFNGFGGLASLLVGWAEYTRIVAVPETHPVLLTNAIIYITVLIGGLTFSGSIYAFGKLSGRVDSAAQVFEKQKLYNVGLAFAILLVGVGYVLLPTFLGYLLLALGTVGALALGIIGVMPIGGGDMPVVVSLLNSLSGLAASAAGFVIQNNVLIVAGCLVGASGLILTIIMCKAMNRSLANVLFSGFGSTTQSASTIDGEMKASSVEDAYYVLEAANSVVIVPGYGMAVAQAQHVVKELGEILENNATEVRYVIHPVAGRMPGHMNVLLAEADVAYEQLVEMEDVNPTMDTVDVAIVIGANDVVNPAALTDPSSPIYGMPIINVHEARTVYVLKRGQGRGFSGIVNTLFFRDNTRMLYGDAKNTISQLVAQFKES